MKKIVIELYDTLSSFDGEGIISESLLRETLKDSSLVLLSMKVVDDPSETYDHIKKGWLNNGDR